MRRLVVAIGLVVLAAAGFAFSSFALGPGEHVACTSATATASASAPGVTTPDHVIGADGAPVYTFPGVTVDGSSDTQTAVAQACVTATDQTVTVTTTVGTTAPPPPPPPPPPSSPLPPNPPAAYAIPAGAVRVTSTSGLLSALSSSALNIVLANGAYGNSSCISVNGKHLWAENLGGAILNSGLEFGGNFVQPGGEIHGLKINLATAGAGCSSTAIDTWGRGANVHVWDSWLDGNNRAAAGGINSTVGGLDVRRSVITGFYSSGIRSWCNCHDPPHASTHPTR